MLNPYITKWLWRLNNRCEKHLHTVKCYVNVHCLIKTWEERSGQAHLNWQQLRYRDAAGLFQSHQAGKRQSRVSISQFKISSRFLFCSLQKHVLFIHPEVSQACLLSDELQGGRACVLFTRELSVPFRAPGSTCTQPVDGWTHCQTVMFWRNVTHTGTFTSWEGRRRKESGCGLESEWELLDQLKVSEAQNGGLDVCLVCDGLLCQLLAPCLHRVTS